MRSQPNEEYIQKADYEVSTLAPGGKLQDEQAEEFFELIIDQSVLMPKCTVRTFSGPSFEQPKIGFESTVLRPATESTPLGVDDRAVATHDKVTITPQSYIASVRMSYETVEDAIGRGQFQQKVKQLLAERVNLDMEMLLIRGDTALGNTSQLNRLLRTQDGIIKQIVTNSVATTGRFSKSALEAMARTMPARYWNPGKLAVLTSKNAGIDYAASVANRQTSMGDDALKSGATGLFSGVPILPIPLMPENLGSGTDETVAILCNPKDILIGFRRDVTVEAEPDIESRTYKVVMTVRYGFKWIHEPAVVICTGIDASP